MKKLNYLFFAFLCFVSLLGLSGCQSQTKRIETLKNAVEEIKNETNYTIEAKATLSVPDDEVIELELKAKITDTKVLLEVKYTNQKSNESDSVKAFLLLEGETLYLYAYDEDSAEWELEQEIDLNELKDKLGDNSLNIPQLEITEELFEYKKGVYVGKTEKLNEEIISKIKDLLEDIEPNMSAAMDNIDISINKYNITLKKKVLEKLEMNVSATVEEETVSLDLVMNFSNIGSTTVENPVK